jgi:(p)ppGpp synthase/HD superfamily hydrolase
MKFMNKVEQAIYFATKAHNGQNRKMEDIPMIFHPFTVGMMLQRAGCKEEVVIAGILHDVIEDTKYTRSDISKKFGEEVAKLVEGVTEPDKNLSWEERKEDAIKRIHSVCLEIKLIEAADKISNLESTLEDIKRRGDDAWSGFKRGKDKQEWLNRNMYKSVVANTDGKHPLFKRYAQLIKKIFD